ncbi:MAG: hypothetical protein M1819_000398 [Sarea resinae]|nr:MAG: hypothetical protein M1819_000398 [Sarea resinae]
MSAPVSSSASESSKPVAIVTGAASGIGLEVTKLLLARNYTVVLADLNEALGKQQSELLGPHTSFVACDSSSWESQVAVFKATFARFGRVDFVAANAGIAESPPSVYGDKAAAAAAALQGKQHDLEPTKPNLKVVDVNLVGVIYTVSLAAQYMRLNAAPRAGGKIVVTASALGIHPMPAMPLYTTTKHGLIGLTRATAPFLSQSHISISAICPAITETPLTHSMIGAMPPAIISTMDAVLRGYASLVDAAGQDAAGKVLEITDDGVHERPFQFPELSRNWIEAAFLLGGGEGGA